MNNVARPLPQPTLETLPFWEAARQNRLELPWCIHCGRFHFYPRPFCPYCGDTALQWKVVSGAGHIFTWTVNHRPAGAAFEPLVPYAVAVIELQEGPRMMARIVNTPLAAIRIGAPVAAVFEKMSEEISLVNFCVVEKP